MKIKFSSICGVYDCSGAGVHYKIMQREEGAGERVFGKAHEQPFVDRITAQLRPAPSAQRVPEPDPLPSISFDTRPDPIQF